MKTCIVTGADKKYLPGVKALYNSIKRNTNTKADLFLLAHGEYEDFKDLPEDLEIILNNETVNSPSSSEWPEQIPAMYSRVLIPRLFQEYDRALWLDADIIVLKEIDSLIEMELESYPCAAALPSLASDLNFLNYQIENPEKLPGVENIPSLQAGVFLFDIKKWNESGLNEKIDELLQSDIKFRFVVQGLMGAAVWGNFKQIPQTWNCYANWVGRIQLKDINILHYVGGRAMSPWTHNMPCQEIWNEYKENT